MEYKILDIVELFLETMEAIRSLEMDQVLMDIDISFFSVVFFLTPFPF